MYLYQERKEYYAQISQGMEEMGAEELKELGAYYVKEDFRGIHFKSDKEALYRINYCSRLSTRIIAPIVSFKCFDTDTLYKNTLKINWDDFLKTNKTFAIFSNISDSRISHSKFASLRMKDAIADYFMKKYKKRPSVDTQNPDVWFHLHIRKDKAVISVETSGGSLHRRGYRKETITAPMQETLAAAIIRLSEFDGSKKIYDPMCGSGTILAEALMSYSNTPAMVLRKTFGFQSLPDYDNKLWEKLKKAEDTKIRPVKQGLIHGSDINGKAIRITRDNLRNLRGGDNINLKQCSFKDIEGIENAIIVCNPPYGIRMKSKGDLGQFYKDFGDFLKQKCKGSVAYIFFGEREYIKKIGLKPSFKKMLKNGGLEGRLVKIELY